MVAFPRHNFVVADVRYFDVRIAVYFESCFTGLLAEINILSEPIISL